MRGSSFFNRDTKYKLITERAHNLLRGTLSSLLFFIRGMLRLFLWSDGNGATIHYIGIGRQVPARATTRYIICVERNQLDPIITYTQTLKNGTKLSLIIN